MPWCVGVGLVAPHSWSWTKTRVVRLRFDMMSPRSGSTLNSSVSSSSSSVSSSVSLLISMHKTVVMERASNEKEDTFLTVDIDKDVRKRDVTWWPDWSLTTSDQQWSSIDQWSSLQQQGSWTVSCKIEKWWRKMRQLEKYNEHHQSAFTGTCIHQFNKLNISPQSSYIFNIDFLFNIQLSSRVSPHKDRGNNICN